MPKYSPFDDSGGGVVYWHLGLSRPNNMAKPFLLVIIWERITKVVNPFFYYQLVYDPLFAILH